MNFQVPQYVDLEDKLAFRLTLKQLLWFALGGVILFIFWIVFEKWVFWVSAPFVVAAAAAFAFYKPAGLTLFTFLVEGMRHWFRPKKLTWVKEEEDLSQLSIKEIKKPVHSENVGGVAKKDISVAGDLAKILDEKSDL